MPKKIPMLAYHRVHNDDDVSVPDDSNRVNVSDFRRQVDYLTDSGVRTVTHAEIADWLYEGREPEGRCIAMDFHDNRLNIFENAFPLLSERGLRGTAFVITDLASGKSVFGPNDFPAMDWGHLRKLSEAGWCIAPHTRKHLFLDGPERAPKDIAETWAEVTESRRAVIDNIGIDAPYFTYPHGRWNLAVEAMVKAVYRTAMPYWHLDMTPEEWPMVTEATNPYRLTGINVSTYMPFETFCEIVDGAR